MPVFSDQLGRNIELTKIPQRIVSIVPSQTELLFDIGLHEEVIGITKFCIRPEEWYRSKTKIGGTKQLKMDSILQLQPDLIIANKEENTKSQIEELAKHFPVWISDVNTIEDACAMIAQIGIITGREENAIAIATTIKNKFFQLQPLRPAISTAYLIWKEPYMTIGSDTFIHAILQSAGFVNAFADARRYPAISIDDIKEKAVEVLMLSTEPFPFNFKHIEELQLQLPHIKIILVNGEAFSWYGSRLLETPAYLQKVMQQAIH